MYASVLLDHLGVDQATAQTILGRSFETLPIFRRAVEPENPTLTFALAQNSPNPFVEQTEISFSLTQAQSVRLAVFDLQGRELTVLREGRLDAGNYAVPLSGTGLAAGHYLYSLQTDGGRAVKRMVRV